MAHCFAYVACQTKALQSTISQLKRISKRKPALHDRLLGTTLCPACIGIFDREVFPGLEETQPHHKAVDDLRLASVNGCYVCSFVCDMLPEEW